MTAPEDAEERTDAIAKPLTVEVRGSVDLRVSIRSYSSGHLLWTAQHEAELAGQVEAGLAGKVPFSLEHRGYVLSSIIASVAFLEAMVNELFQDAADGKASQPDGYLSPLSADCRRLMADLWRATREGKRLGTIEKFERLLSFAQAPPLDRGGQVYENAMLTIRLRNTLVHFRPEDRSAEDEAHEMERLIGKFADNALMAGSGNPWWPYKALGYGAADWAHRSVKALADQVSDAVGIVPNYRRQEAAGWEQAPGVRTRLWGRASIRRRRARRAARAPDAP
jgi:hypothetical protein